jgi:hypothetical protein
MYLSALQFHILLFLLFRLGACLLAILPQVTKQLKHALFLVYSQVAHPILRGMRRDEGWGMRGDEEGWGMRRDEVGGGRRDE